MTRVAGLLAPDFLAPDFLSPDSETSYNEWRERVEAELGGKAFEKALCRVPLPGAPLRQPVYVERLEATDGAGDDAAGFPGHAPHVRGSHTLGRGWRVAQEYRDAAEARRLDRAALDQLSSFGVDLLWFDLPEQVLKQVLTQVDLTSMAVAVSGASPSTPGCMLDEAERQGVALESLRGCLGCDPLGALGLDAAPDLDDALDLAAEYIARSRQAPGLQALLVDLSPYHNAGADAVFELALLASSGVEMLRRMDGRGLEPGRADVDVAAEELLFAVSVGGDIFTEIAKLRAARLLWSKVVRACGGSEASQRLRLHARTSAVSRTVRGPWTNMLRGTTESFAAALGGVDSLAMAPFDERLGVPDPSSRRLAVGTQHVLREEAGLGQVLDPAGGSYYLEQWTDKLARAAWTLFQEMEGLGGLVACRRQGWIDERLADLADRRQRDVNRRRTGVVGVSEFVNLEEEPLVRDPGEPSVASSFEPFFPVAPFEALRQASDRWQGQHGQRPRVFLAQIGSPSDYRPRSGFATSFLATGGLRAVDDGSPDRPLSDTNTVADAFEASGAELAVLCSSDEIYPDVVALMAPALKSRGARAVLLAGRPGEREAAWREAGVDHFLYMGCDAIEVLTAVWASLEGQPS